MPPPDFHLDHTLSDWPSYTLELRCPCSPLVTFMPVRLLAERGQSAVPRRAGGAAVLDLPRQAGAGPPDRRAFPDVHGRGAARLGVGAGAVARVAPRPSGA